MFCSLCPTSALHFVILHIDYIQLQCALAVFIFPKFSNPAYLMLCSIRLPNNSHLLVILSSEYTYSITFRLAFWNMSQIQIQIQVQAQTQIYIQIEMELEIQMQIQIQILIQIQRPFYSLSFGNRKAEVVFTLYAKQNALCSSIHHHMVLNACNILGTMPSIINSKGWKTLFWPSKISQCTGKTNV